MVKRGGREIITMDIFKENYLKLKKEAEAEKEDVKGYLNKLIEDHISQKEFLDKIAPSLGLEEIEGDKIILKDPKERKFIDLHYTKDLNISCTDDKCKKHKEDCKHKRFVYMNSDIIAKLIKLL